MSTSNSRRKGSGNRALILNLIADTLKADDDWDKQFQPHAGIKALARVVGILLVFAAIALAFYAGLLWFAVEFVSDDWRS